MPRPESCCDRLHGQVTYYCDQHKTNCPDQVLKWSEYYKAYMLSSGNTYYECCYCPWCGVKLPSIDENRPPLDEWLKI